MSDTLSGKVAALASYVPPPIVSRLAAGTAIETSATGIEAAVLFADVSGFTRLAETLVAEGASASERLSTVLNRYFGRIIDLIDASGGAVYDFAGDAVIAVWTVDGSDRRSAVLRAAQCAAALAAELHDQSVAPGLTLSLRASVGLGPLWTATMSGSRDRWYFVATGPSLNDALQAQRHAQPGEAIVSPGAAEALGGGIRGTPRTDGHVLLGNLPPLPAAPPRTRSLHGLTEEALRPFVPEPVLAAIDTASGAWRAELRKVVVMFVRLDGLQYDAPGALGRVQDALRSVDDTLRRYGGAIGQFVVDDKGTVIVAAWGLPGSTFENNAARALSAAAALPDALADGAGRCSVGLAAGRVFCGDRGSAVRREYAMIGTAVIRAARLMTAADGQSLCDESIRAAFGTERAADDISIEPAGTVTLKGAPGPVPVFRPVRRAPAVRTEATSGALIGREAERADIRRVLAAFADPAVEPAGGTLVIEGEAGIGKSRLMAIVTETASTLGVRLLAAAASASENTAAYHPWRGIFGAILGVADLRGEARHEAVRRRVEALLPGNAEQAPLLNQVLGLDLPETPLMAQMQGEARANVTIAMLAGLLRAGAVDSGGRTVLTIEDAHWLDSPSWLLLAAIRREIPAIQVVLSTRPIADPRPRGYEQVTGTGTEWIRPGALTRDNLAQLVPLRLRADVVDDAILDFIFAHGGGNPFFTEETAFALRDGGHLSIIDGRCSLASRRTPLEKLVPPTVEGTVAMRIDRLDAQQQLTLKVASVIARDFSLSALEACYPVRTPRAELLAMLRALVEVDLAIASTDGPDPGFTFKHAITQQVAYDLLPFAQRRSLHLTLATWYEGAHAENLAPMYPVLAHHYSASETTDKAIHYLDKAGFQALQHDANHEAVGFLGRAHALAVPDRAPSARDKRPFADREYGLSEGYRRLGRMAEAEENLRLAIADLGRRMPRGRVGAIAAMLQLAGDQFVRRTFKRAVRAPYVTERDRDDGRLAYLLYDRFARVAFLNMSTDLSVVAALSALAEAERLGKSPELARAYGNICGAVGLIPMPKLARAYERRALDTLDAIGEHDTLASAFVRQTVALFTCGIGDWERSATYLNQAAALFERHGDLSETCVTLTMLGRVEASRGRFPALGEIGRRIMALSKSRDAVVEYAWGLDDVAEEVLCVANDATRCLAICDEALEMLQGTHQDSSRAVTHALQSAAHARLGRFGEAEARAEQCTAIFAGMQPTSYGVINGYSLAAWSLLDCWEHAAARGDADGVARLAAKTDAAIRQLLAYARIFPIGVPRARLTRARVEALRGRPDRAARLAQDALAAAEATAMEYEAMLAHLEIGRLATRLPPDRRRQHLERAATIASALGTPYDEGCARKAIGQLPL